MTYQEARMALDTGRRVMHKDVPCIVTAVMECRDIAYRGYQPYCTGDKYISVRLIEQDKRKNYTLDARLVDIMTVEEYKEQKERENHG